MIEMPTAHMYDTAITVPPPCHELPSLTEIAMSQFGHTQTQELDTLRSACIEITDDEAFYDALERYDEQLPSNDGATMIDAAMLCVAEILFSTNRYAQCVTVLANCLADLSHTDLRNATNKYNYDLIASWIAQLEEHMTSLRSTTPLSAA